MDNKAYLDQIAVKGKVKSGPIFTPMLIKLIAAGAVMLITMIIVGAVISGANAKVTQTYERVYLRITNLAGEESPLKASLEQLRDSDLRSSAGSLLSTLKSTTVTLESIAENIGIKPDSITPSVQTEEDANTADLTASFDEAVLTGNIDLTYATKVYHQISVLLAYEAEARAKTPNAEFASLLDQSTNDLTILQEQFKKFTSSSN